MGLRSSLDFEVLSLEFAVDPNWTVSKIICAFGGEASKVTNQISELDRASSTPK